MIPRSTRLSQQFTDELGHDAERAYFQQRGHHASPNPQVTPISDPSQSGTRWAAWAGLRIVIWVLLEFRRSSREDRRRKAS